MSMKKRRKKGEFGMSTGKRKLISERERANVLCEILADPRGKVSWYETS